MGIALRQFEQMERRLSGRDKAVAEPVTARTAAARPVGKVILGVDPSLRGTGYGVVQVGRVGVQSLEHGTIRCPGSWPRSRCFVRIGEELGGVLARHRPEICVIEGLFYAQNLQTALVMGEARGAILLTVAAAGLEVFEMAPRKVKQAIVGYGAAQKEAVARKVQRLLKLEELPAPDAADALALALTHAQEQGRYSLTMPKPI